MIRARHSDRQQPGAEGMLTENEGSPPGRAALLRVGMRKHRPFVADAIDVWYLVTHDTVVIRADIVHANIVTPDHENVGLVCFPAWTAVIVNSKATKKKFNNTYFLMEPSPFFQSAAALRRQQRSSLS